MAAKPNGNRMLSMKEVIALQRVIFQEYTPRLLQDDKFADYVNTSNDAKQFAKPVTASNVRSVREALGIEGYFYRASPSQKAKSLEDRVAVLEAQVAKLVNDLGA